MDHSSAQPYLTSELSTSSAELDLSGARPFNLNLIVTLHAPEPIRVYIDDTSLSPLVALHKGGVDFVRKDDDSKPVPQPTIDINRGNAPDRAWHSEAFLTLLPNTPKNIAIPLGSRDRSSASDNKSFDVRLWINASGLESGKSYQAMLPAFKISWGCWESRSTISWWHWLFQSRRGDEASVPILPEEQQLPIHVVGTAATFTCVGKHVQPPGNHW